MYWLNKQRYIHILECYEGIKKNDTWINWSEKNMYQWVILPHRLRKSESSSPKKNWNGFDWTCICSLHIGGFQGLRWWAQSFSWSQFSPRGGFAPQKMTKDIFYFHSWGRGVVHLASGGWRSGYCWVLALLRRLHRRELPSCRLCWGGGAPGAEVGVSISCCLRSAWRTTWRTTQLQVFTSFQPPPSSSHLEWQLLTYLPPTLKIAMIFLKSLVWVIS